MAKAIHAMFRVLDEGRSRDFYARAFGLEIADRFEFDGFTLVYLRNREADFEVELTVNHGRTEPYDLGDGYGHIAVAVDDLDAEHARFTEAGLAPARSRNSCATARCWRASSSCGSRRLQDGGAPAARPLRLNRHKPIRPTNKEEPHERESMTIDSGPMTRRDLPEAAPSPQRPALAGGATVTVASPTAPGRSTTQR